MKEYKHLIFDIDNTILDFTESERHALRAVFTQYGVIYNEESVATYSKINGALWEQLEEGTIKKEVLLSQRFSTFFQTQGISVDGAVADDAFRTGLENRVDLIEGSKEVLKTLKERGYRIYAGTNGVGRTQRNRLERAGLMPYFDELFISEEVGFEKPDVRFFDFIFNQLQLTDVQNVLMIGDSLTSDIRGANRYGIDSVWLNERNMRADDNKPVYTVKKLTELIKMLV